MAQNTGDEPRRFEFRIENGRVADNAGTVQGAARRGRRTPAGPPTASVWLCTCTAMTLKSRSMQAKPQTMAFRARATGRFPIEMHG